jgi:hypothetical protein
MYLLLLCSTHIFAYVVSSRVRLLISAAPANGALKASVQYPIIPMSLTRSLGLMAVKWVVPERMLCMSACEGDVMLMINMVFVSLISLGKQATTRSDTHM